MGELKKRVELAVGSLLENEALTSALDDDAANILLNWGVAQAEVIVRRTDGLDDEAAEEVIYAPMRAVRRLMRAVNRWLPKRETPDEMADQSALTKVLAQAAIIYGDDFTAPTDKQQADFLTQIQGQDATQTATALLALFEKPQPQPTPSLGATIATGVQPSAPKPQKPTADKAIPEKEPQVTTKTVAESAPVEVDPQEYSGLWGRLRKTRKGLSNFFFGHL